MPEWAQMMPRSSRLKNRELAIKIVKNEHAAEYENRDLLQSQKVR